jgi:hypothetical protein
MDQGSSSEHDQIHEAVRLDPESVWDRLRLFLCASATGPSGDAEALQRADLIEDLMFWHAEEFIDRLEKLVEECPALHPDVVMAHVGGRAVGPGLERFYALQESLVSALEADGQLTQWKGWVPMEPPKQP